MAYQMKFTCFPNDLLGHIDLGMGVFRTKFDAAADFEVPLP